MAAFWQDYGYAWFILPLIIFLARILDVSISTLRLTFLARGARIQASVIGFFEALIWIIVISQVIRNLDNVMCYVAYAAGFATGTYAGMRIEEKLAMGKVVMRIITAVPTDDLLNVLRENQFAVTNLPAEGAKGPVQILFMALKRTDMPRAVELIKKTTPRAFYTVQDVRYANEGVFPRVAGKRHTGVWPAARWLRWFS